MALAGGEQREVIDLTREQLLELAELIHLQEVEKLHELQLDYLQQQVYLNTCKLAWETTTNLLNDTQTTKDKAEAENDADKISIAHDVFHYSRKCVSFSLQFIRSYSTRLTFMNKLTAHTTDLIKLLNTLDPATQVEEARRLAKQAAIYKDFIIDYERKLNSFLPNQLTRWIKETGTTVDDLVVKYMAKLGYEGLFEELTDVQKLHVYESVIEAAGRGKSVVTHTYEALGHVGVAVLVFTAATMVWDIATAENKLEAATRDAVNLFVGEIAVGDIAGVVIAAGFEALEIEVATAMITVMGSIVGFGVAALIGVAAGELLDLVFNSGGKVQPSDGLTVCRVVRMPDGLELARNIKRNDPNL